MKEADQRRLRRRLREGPERDRARKRPSHRAADKRDELAPFHGLCPQADVDTLAYRWVRIVLCITAK
jgi:hypothetical protein